MNSDQTHQIFISYATPDRERVVPFYEALKGAGLNVWMDFKNLKGGQAWDFEIKRAFEKSAIVVAFISRNSVTRRGYVQREIKLALDKLTEKLIEDIYIIPVLLDSDVEIPAQLKGIHCISIGSSDAVAKVIDSAISQLRTLGAETMQVQKKEGLSWTFDAITESWDGLPGYEVNLQVVNFRSDKYRGLELATAFIKGKLIGYLFNSRSRKLQQEPGRYNYGQDEFSRTDTLDAHSSEPSIVGKILTVQYGVSWYTAGAAHGGYDYLTFSFVLNPLCIIERLDSIFLSPHEALPVMQEAIRRNLIREVCSEDGEPQPASPDSEWVKIGTRNWEDFNNFVPKVDGIDFLFPQYQVASYAEGPQHSFVPYSEFVDLMRVEYQAAFGVEHLAGRRKLVLEKGEDNDPSREGLGARASQPQSPMRPPGPANAD